MTSEKNVAIACPLDGAILEEHDFDNQTGVCPECRKEWTAITLIEHYEQALKEKDAEIAALWKTINMHVDLGYGTSDAPLVDKG
jgi:uncharacterized Zn ribbon protein